MSYNITFWILDLNQKSIFQYVLNYASLYTVFLTTSGPHYSQKTASALSFYSGKVSMDVFPEPCLPCDPWGTHWVLSVKAVSVGQQNKLYTVGQKDQKKIFEFANTLVCLCCSMRLKAWMFNHRKLQLPPLEIQLPLSASACHSTAAAETLQHLNL